MAIGMNSKMVWNPMLMKLLQLDISYFKESGSQGSLNGTFFGGNQTKQQMSILILRDFSENKFVHCFAW